MKDDFYFVGKEKNNMTNILKRISVGLLALLSCCFAMGIIIGAVVLVTKLPTIFLIIMLIILALTLAYCIGKDILNKY